MDPFLVLLHSVSVGLSSSELTDLKFLCQSYVGKRKLERVQSGLDLFSVLLEQNELDAQHTQLLRDLLSSVRRQDLLRLLDDFEAGATARAPPEEQGARGTATRAGDEVGSVWAGTNRGREAVTRERVCRMATRIGDWNRDRSRGPGPGNAEPVSLHSSSCDRPGA